MWMALLLLVLLSFLSVILLMSLLCRPDGIGTVLREEWDKFLEIKDRMRQFLEHQITNFR